MWMWENSRWEESISQTILREQAESRQNRKQVVQRRGVDSTGTLLGFPGLRTPRQSPRLEVACSGLIEGLFGWAWMG